MKNLEDAGNMKKIKVFVMNIKKYLFLAIFIICAAFVFAKPGFIYYDDADTYAVNNDTSISDNDALSVHGWTTTGGGKYQANCGFTGRCLNVTSINTYLSSTIDFDNNESLNKTSELLFRTEQTSYIQLGWHAAGITYYALFGNADIYHRINGISDFIEGNIGIFNGLSWHKLKMIKYTNGTMHLFVNNTLKNSGVTGNQAINRFYLNGDPTANTYIDNFMVYYGKDGKYYYSGTNKELR